MQTIVIIAACVIGVLAFLYGVWRRFSRLTWIGWQLPLVFAASLLLDVLPVPANGKTYFFLVIGVFTLLVLAVFGIGGLMRGAMYKHGRAKGGLHAVNCLGGGVTSVLTVAVLLAFFAAAALAGMSAFGVELSFLAAFAESAVGKFIYGHAYDFVIIAIFMVFVRAGFRLGLIRAIFYLLMFALTYASVAGAILLATRVGFFEQMGAGLAANFTGTMPAAVATVLGHGIIALILFALIFAVVMLFGALVHKGIKKLSAVRVLSFIDGFILCLIFAGVFFAAACGINYAAARLGSVAPEGSLGEISVQISTALQRLFTSSPLSRALYEYNPLLTLLGV